MASRKTKNKQIRSNENREAKRRRWLQIIIIGFSIILILSMILSLAATT